ncbi:35212_t:CDS:2, partial [Racocetra persica]
KNYENIHEEFKKKQKKYKEALDIAKEIPDNYRNIKIIIAYCNKEIGYDESAFKLYEEITNKKIEDLKKEENFNKVEQLFRVTEDRFKNNLEIWKHIKNKYEGLSEIADKKINKYNHSHRKARQQTNDFSKYDVF